MENINTKHYWDKKHLEEHGRRFVPLQRLLYHNFIFENIKTNSYLGNIIDVGCGSAVFLECAIKEKNLQNMKFYGVDFSSEVISKNREYFRKYGSKIIFECSEITNLLYENQYFDNVVCMETLEHITEYGKAIKELCRICKKGGSVFIVVPNKDAIRTPEHINSFSCAAMLELLSEYGYIERYKRIVKPNGRSVRNLAFQLTPNK